MPSCGRLILRWSDSGPECISGLNSEQSTKFTFRKNTGSELGSGMSVS